MYNTILAAERNKRLRVMEKEELSILGHILNRLFCQELIIFPRRSV